MTEHLTDSTTSHGIRADHVSPPASRARAIAALDVSPVEMGSISDALKGFLASMRLTSPHLSLLFYTQPVAS